MDTVKVNFLDCTGINEQLSLKVDVYPNPGNGLFNLQLSGSSAQKVNMKVMNAGGTVVYSANAIQVNGNQKIQIDLSRQPAGVYSLIIDGKQRISRKLIIQ